jgi:hypothetical protein
MKTYVQNILKLQKLFNHKLDSETIECYLEYLIPRIQPDQFSKICDEIIKTFLPTSTVPFPVISHFLNEIKENNETKINDMIEILRCGIAVGEKNMSQMGIADQSFIQAVLSLGGPFNLRKWSNSDWKFKKGAIKDAYEFRLRRADNKKQPMLENKNPQKIKNLIRAISNKNKI